MLAKSLYGVSAFALTCLCASPSFAGPKIFSSGGTIATINGSLETNANANRDPWIAQVFSTGGECLRIAVTSQGTDLEATLISPQGRVWQDDDSNGALRPLIKAQTDFRGWYPLAIHSWNGANVNADFTFTVQRGAAGGPLCTPPTPPRIASPAAAKTGGSLGSAPEGGPN